MARREERVALRRVEGRGEGKERGRRRGLCSEVVVEIDWAMVGRV